MRLDDLSPRQKDVVLGISRGLTYQEVADELILGKSTVRNYANELYKLLDIRTGNKGVQAARWVWEQEHETNSSS
jgi:DNA-binding NarL/FixJ family response regulator